jgi:hypothetical protein
MLETGIDTPSGVAMVIIPPATETTLEWCTDPDVSTITILSRGRNHIVNVSVIEMVVSSAPIGAAA